MKIFRRVVHTTFRTSVPSGSEYFAVRLANEIIEFLTTQTDVYLRCRPLAANGLLAFRLGLDRNPNQQFPGRLIASDTAFEELAEISGRE